MISGTLPAFSDAYSYHNQHVEAVISTAKYHGVIARHAYRISIPDMGIPSCTCITETACNIWSADELLLVL